MSVGEGVEGGGWDAGGRVGGWCRRRRAWRAVGYASDDAGAGVGAAGTVLVGVEVRDRVDAEGVQAGCPVVLVGVAAVGDDEPRIRWPSAVIRARVSRTGLVGLVEAGTTEIRSARQGVSEPLVPVGPMGATVWGSSRSRTRYGRTCGVFYAPGSVGVGGAVLALAPFSPRPGAGPVDGIAAGVGDRSGHGCGQHQVEDFLQEAARCSSSSGPRPAAVAGEESSLAWIAESSRRIWCRVITAPVRPSMTPRSRRADGARPSVRSACTSGRQGSSRCRRRLHPDEQGLHGELPGRPRRVGRRMPSTSGAVPLRSTQATASRRSLGRTKLARLPQQPCRLGDRVDRGEVQEVLQRAHRLQARGPHDQRQGCVRRQVRGQPRRP